MSPLRLRIRFCPVVAFVVSCRPAETKPADKDREISRTSMNKNCCLAANGAKREGTKVRKVESVEVYLRTNAAQSVESSASHWIHG